MGQHDLAEQMFYLAQQIEPDCALCYYNIGNSLFSRGLYKKAIHCWVKTAELESTHPQINYRIAQALWAEGELERSRQHFLRELRINPGDPDVIVDFGLFLLETGDIESAKEKFHRALELKPDTPAALFYLGEIAFQNNDYERALKFFDQAIEKDGSLTGPRYRMAQYALMQGQKDKAASFLASEVKLAPADANVLVSIASMFLKIAQDGKSQKPFDDPELDYAMHCLLRAIDTDSASADAYYYLGVVNAIKGRLEDAAELFAHALDINPEHMGALRDSAIVYLAMHKPDDAANRVKRAIEACPNNPQLKAIFRDARRKKTTEKIRGFVSRFKT